MDSTQGITFSAPRRENEGAVARLLDVIVPAIVAITNKNGMVESSIKSKDHKGKRGRTATLRKINIPIFDLVVAYVQFYKFASAKIPTEPMLVKADEA